MDIAITGRNIDLTDEIKDYASKKLSKAEKLYRRIYKCELILEKESERLNAEIIIYLRSNKLVAKESSQDLFASIDLASHNINKQLRRLRGKLHSKRRKAVMRNIMSPAAVFAGRKPSGVVESAGDIVEVDAFADKPMLPDEARMEIDIRGLDFLMFRNADTSEVNVLYRRKDGSYGRIEPKF